MANEESAIWSLIAGRFVERGWTEQPLSARSFNRQWALQRPNGLVATTSVFVGVYKQEGQVSMAPGVSHEAVAALRAALTLSPHQGELLREGPMLLRPTPLGQAELVQMVDQVTYTAVSVADAFADADELLTELGAKGAAGYDGALESAFLLAGAVRNAPLAEHYLNALDASRSGTPVASYTRFIRQARRWLDAGMPDVPPITERRPREPEPFDVGQVLLSSLRNSDTRHDAELRLFRQVRRNRSLTTAELRRLLSDDLTAHGLTRPSTTVATIVDRVQREQTLLGLVRTRVDAAQHVIELSRRVRTAVEQKRLPTAPAEAAPPEHAVFTYRSVRHADVEVELDPAALPWLRAMTARNEIRVRRISHFTVWLDGHQVMVGNTRVGVLPAAAAEAFDATLASATALDEYPRAPAIFLDLPQPVLSLPLPVQD